MNKQILPLAILTAALGFAEVPAPRSILTTCAPGPKQAKCVLQEFTATEPRATAKASTIAAIPGPFQQEFDLKIYDGSNAVVGRIDIPAGMQVVVESVSTYATVPIGQAPRVSVSTTVRGADGNYFVPMVKQETVDKIDWLCSTQPMRIYHDGAALFVLITRSQSVGEANFSISVSGTMSYSGQ